MAKDLRRRLFAGDAAQGFAFIDLCRKRYEVVVMNSPFGQASEMIEGYLQRNHCDWNFNLFCCFIARASDLSQFIGAITDRAFMLKTSYEDYRKIRLLSSRRLKISH